MQRNQPKFISNHEDLEVYKIAFDAAFGDLGLLLATQRGF